MARKKISGNHWRTTRAKRDFAHLGHLGGTMEHEIAKRRHAQRRHHLAVHKAQLAADANGGWGR